ncbi:hypothetical protein CK203_062542 [Vitis vinifera]|uniref:Uncharacterized protein n=1 Tax=Vitis vinifera TaxID=29760 RepID=A0A438FWT0_VITVI|nr:hypothetical protein CK203_062542 [Vitis vinifera]
MVKMLKRIPCFTKAEPLSTKMSNFFPLTKRISVNLGGNPPISVSTRFPFGTPKFVISPIQPMQDYTDQETTEVVSFASSLVVEAMRVFITQKMGGSEELRTKLERAESDLAAAQKAATTEPRH